MPFTISHAAAVLPLHKVSDKHLCFSALIIGSMTPDLPYFWGDFGLAARAHTSMGIPLICLPLGIIAYFLLRSFANYIAQICYSPFDRIFIKMAESKPTMFSLILSITIGAWSHNIWDAFTHRNGWFAAKIPLLHTTIFSTANQVVPLYYFLQQLSTVIGLLIVLFFSYKTSQKLPKIKTSLQHKTVIWLLIILCSAVALTLQLHSGNPEYFSNFETLRKNVFFVVVSTIRNLIICTATSVTLLWLLELKGQLPRK